MFPAALSNIPTAEIPENVGGVERRPDHGRLNSIDQAVSFVELPSVDQSGCLGKSDGGFSFKAQAALVELGTFCFLAKQNLLLSRFVFPDKQPNSCAESQNQHQTDGANHDKQSFVSMHQLPKAIKTIRRSRDHRLGVEIMSHVHRQTGRRLVAQGSILLQRLHDNPIEIALEKRF